MSEEYESIITYTEDVSQAEAPKPLPEGEYLAQIEKAEVAVNKNGEKYLKTTLRIMPEQFPIDFDAEDYPDGVMLMYMRPSLEDTKRARYQMRRFADTVGITVTNQFDVDSLVGLEVKVSTRIGEWEGEERTELKSILGAA